MTDVLSCDRTSKSHVDLLVVRRKGQRLRCCRLSPDFIVAFCRGELSRRCGKADRLGTIYIVVVVVVAAIVYGIQREY
jgi:hypothetical protein